MDWKPRHVPDKCPTFFTPTTFRTRYSVPRMLFFSLLASAEPPRALPLASLRVPAPVHRRSGECCAGFRGGLCSQGVPVTDRGDWLAGNGKKEGGGADDR